jgi:hypothetical protein
MTIRTPVAPLPFQAPTSIDTTALPENSRPANSAAQWEMVIPKMVRPASRLVAAQSVVASPALADPLAEAAAGLIPSDSVDVAEDHAFSAPSLLLSTSDDTFFARSWRQIALAIIALATVGFLLLGRSGAGASSARDRGIEAARMGGWSRRSISPPGRLMSVYEPSREEADYRIQFAWVPDANGVGWVFRTRDANDYYAVRLRLIKPGASLVLAAEHFSVWRGEESVHSRKIIPLVNNSGLVRVRMDAIGPSFTLSLQDSPIDTWTDARLDSGAVGFYDEHGQRAAVQALRFTFIRKGSTRTAVESLP